MVAEADIAAVAALLADPTRAGFLVALSDGHALPAEISRGPAVYHGMGLPSQPLQQHASRNRGDSLERTKA